MNHNFTDIGSCPSGMEFVLYLIYPKISEVPSTPLTFQSNNKLDCPDQLMSERGVRGAPESFILRCSIIYTHIMCALAVFYTRMAADKKLQNAMPT